jgi:hypothetical protein
VYFSGLLFYILYFKKYNMAVTRDEKKKIVGDF